MDLTVNAAQITLSCDRQTLSKIAWHRVTAHDITLFQSELDRHLSQLPLLEGIVCGDINCEKIEHKQDIDYLCSHLTDLCLSCDKQFPRSSMKSKHKCMPGWKDQVKPFQEECTFWYRMWRDMGKPNGFIYDNMRESKRQYLYAIRRCKRKERENRFNKMAECLTENKSRDFYTELKKMKRLRTVSHCINGETDSVKIANIFAAKYKDLFNSVPSCQDLIDKIEDHIYSIKDCDTNSANVTFEAVINAVGKLKLGKGDGHKGLMSNHLAYASHMFYEYMAKLLSAILTHGYIPQELLLSTICSIPKDTKGDLCVDSNYRGIALMSSLSKVMDLIIMQRNCKKLLTSDLQFAYKSQHSPVMCSMALKEVVQYYSGPSLIRISLNRIPRYPDKNEREPIHSYVICPL
jgi:hypothetical protein